MIDSMALLTSSFSSLKNHYLKNMVSIHLSLLALSSVLLAQPSHVKAASLSSDPTIPRTGNGVTTLDSSNMVAGRPTAPTTYAIVTDGSMITMNGTTKVSDKAMLRSSFNGDESTDLTYLQEHYGITFEMNADAIFAQWKSAEAKQMPWPGSYWPAYEDSINFPLVGSTSAAQKYALANGIDPNSFMDKVSAEAGIDAFSYYPGCTDDSQCASGSKCAIRDGKNAGYCIPTWIGICHAWTPAAMLEPEPKCPVVFGGQTFGVQDIKALLTMGYEGAGIQVLYGGVRFNGGDNNAEDQFGRYVDYSHRDVSPALFHVALANIFGRLGDLFLIDADADAAVWNQPIRSYSFSDPTPMDPDDAAQHFFNTPSYSVFNPDAKSVYYVSNEFKYIEEGYDDGRLSIPGVVDKYTQTRTYEYLLELDEQKNIIGGEWLGNSRYDHPDFMWVPLRRPTPGLITNIGLSWDFVNMLNYLSQLSTC